MFACVFITFPYGVSGKVLYLIVSIPDFDVLFTFLMCSVFYVNFSTICSSMI